MSTPAPTHSEHLGEQPSPRPRADLSGAFGPPNRSGGLAGRLARPSRPAPAARPAEDLQSAVATSAPEAVGEGSGSSDSDSAAVRVALLEQALPAPSSHEATGADAPTPAPSVTVARPRKTTGTGGKRAAAAAPASAGQTRTDSEGALVTSIVYVPGEVLKRLRQARAATGLTYTQLALDALDGTHQVLGDLVAKATQPAARPVGSLFSGPSSTPATVNPKVQITLRPRSSDAAIIDRLASDHGTSRSQLLTLALDAHLPRT